MLTHEQLVEKLLQRRGVRKEVERIEHEEMTVVDVLPSTQPPVNFPSTIEDTFGDAIDSDHQTARS